MKLDLMGDRLGLILHVKFTNILKRENLYGVCEIDDDTPPTRPRKFHIEIDKTLSLYEQLETLAHELVHVRQWARGHMYNYADSRIRYKNRIYGEADYTSMKVKELPWEEEALSLEAPTVTKFLDEHQINLREYI